MSQANYTILKKANVTQEEFGQLAGVSRVTVNKWINIEGCRPHPGREVRVNNLLKAIKQAHVDGALPLADFIADKEARMVALRKVVVKTLKQITKIS